MRTDDEGLSYTTRRGMTSLSKALGEAFLLPMTLEVCTASMVALDESLGASVEALVKLGEPEAALRMSKHQRALRGQVATGRWAKRYFDKGPATVDRNKVTRFARFWQGKAAAKRAASELPNLLSVATETVRSKAALHAQGTARLSALPQELEPSLREVERELEASFLPVMHKLMAQTLRLAHLEDRHMAREDISAELKDHGGATIDALEALLDDEVLTEFGAYIKAWGQTIVARAQIFEAETEHAITQLVQSEPSATMVDHARAVQDAIAERLATSELFDTSIIGQGIAYLVDPDYKEFFSDTSLHVHESLGYFLDELSAYHQARADILERLQRNFKEPFRRDDPASNFSKLT